jgi:hypothetical protein
MKVIISLTHITYCSLHLILVAFSHSTKLIVFLISETKRSRFVENSNSVKLTHRRTIMLFTSIITL